MKSWTTLNISTLNSDHKINSINFIWNWEDPIMREQSSRASSASDED
jgi:hypothetical protein